MVDATVYVSVVGHENLLVVVVVRDRVDRHFICLLHRRCVLRVFLCCSTLRLLDPLLLQALDRLCEIPLVGSQRLGKLIRNHTLGERICQHDVGVDPPDGIRSLLWSLLVEHW